MSCHLARIYAALETRPNAAEIEATRQAYDARLGIRRPGTARFLHERRPTPLHPSVYPCTMAKRGKADKKADKKAEKVRLLRTGPGPPAIPYFDGWIAPHNPTRCKGVPLAEPWFRGSGLVSG